MRLLLPCIFILAIFAGCSSSKIPGKTVDHRYENITFSPVEVSKKTSDGIVMTIYPMDAAMLNKITMEAARRDGKYEHEYVMQQNINNLSELSRKERNYIESLLELTENLNNAIEANDFDGEMGSLLLNMLWNGRDIGFDGSETHILTSTNPAPSTFNPYRLSNEYLSVFKIDFQNTSNQMRSISNDNFQIASNRELLQPIKTAYFEENLPGASVELNNIFRMNMPETLRLSPGLPIDKYIAIPPINPGSSSLIIQYIVGDEFLNFEFDVNEVRQQKLYELAGFKIARTDARQMHTMIYAIRHSDGSAFALKEDVFYFDTENLDTLVEICGLGVSSSTRRSPHRIGCVTDVNLSEVTNGQIDISLSRMR